MRRVGRIFAMLAGMLATTLGVATSVSATIQNSTSQPGSPPAVGHLSGVWCISSSNCMAVGGTSGAASAQALAEQWNGLGWTTLGTPFLNNDKDLAAVACPRPALCQAVGATGVERWNGTVWTVEKTPTSIGAPTFSAVSCPTTSFCLAVGERGLPGIAVTLAETWNGSTWSAHNPVNPAGALKATLSSVWCISSSDCLPVGTYEPSNNNSSTLAESWNGSTWKRLDMPTLATSDAALSGISCANATSCIAVGYASPSNLAESWNGTSWSVLPAPPGSSSAIWCISAGNCMAVGGASHEAWNGSPCA